MVCGLAGERYEIPPGTPVHSMGTGGWHTSKRRQTVYPFDIAEYGEWKVITWPGPGGYWRRVVLRDGEYVACWPGHEPETSPARPTWAQLEEGVA
jgi:hypothetical protein